MSDHVWVQEHVAAYLAGGLDAQEAERLEAHARDCPACAAVLAEARRLDDCMSNLFVSAQPALGLEDRAVAKLRSEPARQRPVLNSGAKWAIAIAAVLLLGVIGAVASNAGLRMPGEPAAEPPAGRELALAQKEAESAERARAARDSNLESARSEIDQLNKKVYAGKFHENVTKDPIGQPNSPNPDTTGYWIPGVTPSSSSSPKPTLDAEDKAKGDTGMPADKGPGPGLPPPPPTGPSVPVAPSPVLPPIPSPSGPPVSVAPPPVFDPTKARPDGSNEGLKPSESPKREPGLKTDPKSPATGDPKDPKDVKDPTANPNPNPEPIRRIILRSGDMEFEIESFDAATATITKLVLGIKGAFVATVNSDKLPNGKVKGSITVRVPPEQLDGLVLDLRRELGKGGELKGVKLTSQDVTKMYTDLESRLRAARTMETRLIQIIKEGKGEIKQLLEAEKELGVWRTKIEEAEGEIRYYSNLAAFSTLNISLTEKEIRAAAAITERERVQAGVEVEDVDKAYQQVLAAVVEAKGRITKSELKQLSAGQFNATFNFEVAAEAGGPIRDRLRMLGRVARLEIDRTVHTEGGTLPSDAKAKRGDTVFLVQLYNLANVAPRETATLQIAAADVPKAYQSLRDAVAKTTGRVLVAQLNEQDKQNVSATFDFEIRRAEEGAVRAALEATGDVISRQVARAAESDSVTDSKVMYKVTLYSANRLRARETTTLQIAAADVPAAYQSLRDIVTKATGRVLVSQLNEQDKQNITATFDFEIRWSEEGAVRVALEATGDVLSRQVGRTTDADGVTDAKVLYKVTLFSASRLRPRETATLQLAATDVPTAYQALRDIVAKTTGRVLVSQLNEQDRQNITAELDFEIRRAEEGAVRAALEATGDVLSRQVGRTTDADGSTDAKVLYKVTLLSANRLKPRETTTLAVEVADVDGSATLFAAQVAEVKGRQVDAKLDRDARGGVTAKLVFEVPLAAAPGLVERFKGAGTVRVSQSVRDPQATEGRYATTRIYVTLTNVEAIVPDGTGLWPKVRQGLSISASVLLTSVTWVVFGLCVVLPWALIGFGGYRVVRRFVQPTAGTAAVPTSPSAPGEHPPASL